MVPRDKLYALLQSLGYKGKTLDILQSLYMNDSLRVCVNGRLTEEIYLDMGVKQVTG